MPTHIEYLVKKVFEENTKHGKVPETCEEFDELFSNREYKFVLKDILYGLNVLDSVD